jgi:cystathionine beta-lyase
MTKETKHIQPTNGGSRSVETRLSHLGRDLPTKGGRPVNPPIVRASTILFDTSESFLERGQHRLELGYTTYGLRGTETQFAFEEVVANLEGGYGASTVPSGLAAITATMLAVLKSGDHALVADTVYQPTRAFCDRILTRYGIDITYYDPNIGADIDALIQSNTKLIFMESPGSLTFEVQDVPAIVEIAQKHEILTAIDNTWATPLYFRPLDLGVDISIQAGTKYIVGHSDALIGSITCRERDLHELVRDDMMRFGFAVSAEDAFLALRGLRSLEVRLQRHYASGVAVASWLSERPEVARVFYPALPDDPGHALWKRDFTGASSLFGFELRPVPQEAAFEMIDNLELFGIGASWGGFESLVQPTRPARSRSATRWDAEGPTVRLHIGLEAVDDLIADLDNGFDRLRCAASL